jgi:3-oxoacyl-[acyl-carrier protein] reductase
MMVAQGGSSRVAVITGGAQGIGKAIARVFYCSGYRVAALDLEAQRESVEAFEFVTERDRMAFFGVNLSEPSQIGPLAKSVSDWAGANISAVVNSARFRHRADLMSETPESWDGAMSVGVRAPFFVSRAFAEHMAPGGSIVNVGSITGRLVADESPSYHVSKAGLEQLTKYLAVTLGQRSLRVNCVVPGLVIQERHRAAYESNENADYRRTVEASLPGADPGTEDDVAAAVRFLCSPESKFISGASIVIDGAGSLVEQFGLLRRASLGTR